MCNLGLANTKITTIASVNNYPITNIDIEDEINILRILNANLNQNTIPQEEAINNLINSILKEQEIKQKKIIINEKIIKKEFYKFLENIEKKELKISEKSKKIIYKKIKIELEWNNYISKKFLWKIDVNIEEIDKKISEEVKKNNNIEDLQKYKDNLITIEKNKKLNIYSSNYFELLKKNSVIKFYK